MLPEYTKTKIKRIDNITSNTNYIKSDPHFIMTSQTKGIIKVIIVSKPQKTKNIDRSTF